MSKPVGLRERKRAETHVRIQTEAMRLFLERGFDATTLDDIAAAAVVSRRTLFHYFTSKEDIVFSARADYPDLIAQAVRARPIDEPMLDTVENALRDLAIHYQSPEARALTYLIHSTPVIKPDTKLPSRPLPRRSSSRSAGQTTILPAGLPLR